MLPEELSADICSLKEGKGTVSLDSSGIGSYDVSWPARTEEPNGVTSPEELIATARGNSSPKPRSVTALRTLVTTAR